MDDPAKIQEGARSFAAIGCVNCHGAPWVKWAKFSELANDRTPAQLFWGIKNGVNMTGLPSLGDAEQTIDDDEFLGLVAFN